MGRICRQVAGQTGKWRIVRQACSNHCNEIPFMYSTFMYLWAIYIFPGSVHIFSCSRIGRSIVGIYNSLTDTWMWKLGLWLRNSFSRNICIEFFLLCLCSDTNIEKNVKCFWLHGKDNIAKILNKYSQKRIMFLWAIYIFPPSVFLPILLQERKVDRSWEFINCSQTHYCGNWDWRPLRSFSGNA